MPAKLKYRFQCTRSVPAYSDLDNSMARLCLAVSKLSLNITAEHWNHYFCPSAFIGCFFYVVVSFMRESDLIKVTATIVNGCYARTRPLSNGRIKGKSG